MTFSEKIDKILEINKLGIHSISALEDFCGIGRNTLQNAYDEDRDPTLKILVKLYDKMRVRSEWWKTGKGDIFEEKLTEVSEPAATYGSKDEYIQSLKDHIATLKEQLKLLGKIIDER